MTPSGHSDVSHEYSLSDRYLALEGSVFLSGIQALARIPSEQLRRDRKRGLTTAAFVSGYPGSPLGGFDLEMARMLATLRGEFVIEHLPAVNEELGASAVMGSQLAAQRPDVRYDGVVGIWYGKAPGLDRATDALRHGVFAGSSSLGGALALVGDDPSAKSSTMPSSSDAALVDLHMPILYPRGPAECLELGLHGISLSRATGLWSALKIVTAVADGTATVNLPVLDVDPVLPQHVVDGKVWRSTPSAQFLGPRMVEVEREFHEVRSALALQYGIANKLNQLPANPSDAWIGIVATGFTFGEVREALRRLGLGSLDEIAAAGIRLLNLRMPIPFDEQLIVQFAVGLDEIFVVEEKNPTLERLVRDALYPTTMRPLVIGKTDAAGAQLLQSYGRLDADHIVAALRSRLEQRLSDRLAPEPPEQRVRIPLAVQRAPFFCSGCPHNWGTKVPDDAVVGMGTGCHGMTLLMDEERVGDSIGITAMGNEGAQWLGMERFVDTTHVFQNFGDGTYFHSGQLAVQAAIGAGANVTFKILYNHTVAMTGGQEASHRVQPNSLAAILLRHGVKRVVITTDDVAAYRRVDLPRGVKVFDRTKIIDVQKDLARVEGVTVLIHDQGCAAEIRRARKRKTVATPTTRVVINHRICEGCGDCGNVSNCLSVQPVETPLGRKTQIDQASCNLDLSCLEGDCPAFMTVEVGDGEKPPLATSPPLDPMTISVPDPDPVTGSTVLRLAGIGGTGVVTVAQVIGTAATTSGFIAYGLDQTGLSQKAGPVISDLTIVTETGHEASVNRTNAPGNGQVDVVLAFDQLVAASVSALDGVRRGTKVFASSTKTPTGRQVTDPTIETPTNDTFAQCFSMATGDEPFTADTTKLAEALTGMPATANMLLLGAALQSGGVPLTLDSIRRAIELNGVAVEANKRALEWGRRLWYAPNEVANLLDLSEMPSVDRDPVPADLSSRIGRLELSTSDQRELELLTGDAVAHQDDAQGARLLSLVERAHIAGGTDLAMTVARGFHKLLTYKDEYEVARLMLRDDGLAAARSVTGDRSPAVKWHLHPPTLSALGIDRKIRFGPRTRPLFVALAKAKRMRGTTLDPFGRAELRRVERELIEEYEVGLARVCDALSSGGSSDVEAAIVLASSPEQVRGFEDLKMRRANIYREDFAAKIAAFSTDGKN